VVVHCRNGERGKKFGTDRCLSDQLAVNAVLSHTEHVESMLNGIMYLLMAFRFASYNLLIS
jgi:hypothetical protein